MNVRPTLRYHIARRAIDRPNLAGRPRDKGLRACWEAKESQLARKHLSPLPHESYVTRDAKRSNCRLT
jgi:hypothetical protein